MSKNAEIIKATNGQFDKLLECEIGRGLMIYKSAKDEVRAVNFQFDENCEMKHVANNEKVEIILNRQGAKT